MEQRISDFLKLNFGSSEQTGYLGIKYKDSKIQRKMGNIKSKHQRLKLVSTDITSASHKGNTSTETDGPKEVDIKTANENNITRNEPVVEYSNPKVTLSLPLTFMYYIKINVKFLENRNSNLG